MASSAHANPVDTPQEKTHTSIDSSAKFTKSYNAAAVVLRLTHTRDDLHAEELADFSWHVTGPDQGWTIKFGSNGVTSVARHVDKLAQASKQSSFVAVIIESPILCEFESTRTTPSISSLSTPTSCTKTNPALSPCEQPGADVGVEVELDVAVTVVVVGCLKHRGDSK
jgi:hypothetical protein